MEAAKLRAVVPRWEATEDPPAERSPPWSAATSALVSEHG